MKRRIMYASLVVLGMLSPVRNAAAEEAATHWTAMLGYPCSVCLTLEFPGLCNCTVLPPVIIS